VLGYHCRPASAVGTAITLTVAVPIFLGSPSQVPPDTRSDKSLARHWQMPVDGRPGYAEDLGDLGDGVLAVSMQPLGHRYLIR
jgi:hypothetical protein